MRWLEAYFLGEEDLKYLIKRVEKIISTGSKLYNAIEAVKDKVKKGENLTDEDKSFLDILVFYESLEIYQSPHVHSDLFHTSLYCSTR